MKQSYASLLLLGLLMLGCDQYKLDGYSKTKTGLYYKIHFLGDGERKAKDGDKVFAHMSVYNEFDSLLFRNGLSIGEAFQIELGNVKKGGLNEALSFMHEGDSASFIMNAEEVNLSELTNNKLNNRTGDIRFNISIRRLYNELEERKKGKVSTDREMRELAALKEYLEAEKIGNRNLLDGIYFLPQKEGRGEKVQSGQFVWINYKGYFLDGTEFDNTYKYGQALDFQLGKPDQVIRGFEIALHQMSQGGKARLIIPSALAFGEEGSSTGIVPPYTSVIYDLEVMLVN